MKRQGAEAPLSIGQIVEGKYEVVRLLGEGGMGAVYEVRHTRIGRRLALKALHPRCADNPELVERFVREAQAAAAIGNEHIVDVTDAGETADGAPFIVMEYLEGEDLDAILDREGPFEPQRAVRLLLQVCAGLEAAHQRGIIHRDLKPANLVLTRRADGTEWVKVLDFGVAKVRESLPTMGGASSPELTGTSATLGTPYYMAPEQAWGSKGATARSDIYAAGVVLYELLTGLRPFRADSYNELIVRIATDTPPPPRELRPELSEGLEAVILRAMSRAPEARQASMAELAAELEPFAGEVVSTRLGATAPAVPAAKQRREERPHEAALAETALATGDEEPAAGGAGPDAEEPSAPDDAPRRRGPRLSLALVLASAVAVALVVFLVASGALERARPEPTVDAGGPLAVDSGPAADAALVRHVVDGGRQRQADVATAEAGQDAAPDGGDADQSCPPGQVVNEDTWGHCCWPAQVWSKARSECIGEADCQGGMSWRGGACACPEGRLITIDTRDNCCWPGQAWSVTQSLCVGPPSCPNGFRRSGAEDCQPDEGSAIGRLTRGCQASDLSACVALGEAYQGGGAPERQHALLLFRQGCEGGEPRGCLMVARALQEQGGAEALARAATALEAACVGGEAEGCTAVGEALRKGQGLARNLRQASIFFQKGCDGRHLPGCVSLGELYDEGQTIGRDPTKAAALFEQACSGGDATGCARLAAAYDDGDGVAQDPQQAAIHARTACEADQAEGCRLLGQLYHRGRGVPQDDLQAARYARKACDANVFKACRDLGLLHQKGLGVRQDHAEAARLYRKACEGGDALGCRNLAIRFSRGEGVELDHGVAASFYVRACDLGDERGCALAGDQYLRGEGVPRDERRGQKLLRQGCDGGDEWACQQLRR